MIGNKKTQIRLISKRTDTDKNTGSIILRHLFYYEEK